MNKINLLKLALIVVLSTAASSTVYGASFSGSTLLGGNSFSSSNNVDISIATDGTTDLFDGNTYSAKSKHQKGDKTIGSKSNDPKLYFYGGTSTADTSNFSAATDDEYTDTTVWTSM
jgi:hypothetical protein